MKTIQLYKYHRGVGVITVTPKKPRGKYTDMLRLIADEGKVLTNDGGAKCYKVIDVYTADGWEEIDPPAPVEPAEEAEPIVEEAVEEATETEEEPTEEPVEADAT